MPVDNNEHQRIDDVSTDHISYDIQSLANWVLHCDVLINYCLTVLSKCHNDRPS